MNRRFYSLVRIAFQIVMVLMLFQAAASGSQIPITNIVVQLDTGDVARPAGRDFIMTSLERELRLRGFMGRIRVMEDPNQAPESGETLIKVTITKSRWLTRKLLSIPYIVNRYKREFVMESFVEIPEGKNGMAIKRLKVISEAPAVAQYANNDKFDPALFPYQTEKLETEERTMRLLASRLADHLLNNLK